VVEKADGSVFNTLLEITRWEAGDETENVFQEEEPVVETLRSTVFKGIEDTWDGTEGKR